LNTRNGLGGDIPQTGGIIVPFKYMTDSEVNMLPLFAHAKILVWWIWQLPTIRMMPQTYCLFELPKDRLEGHWWLMSHVFQLLELPPEFAPCQFDQETHIAQYEHLPALGKSPFDFMEC
jgi:hypothetical protein